MGDPIPRSGVGDGVWHRVVVVTLSLLWILQVLPAHVSCEFTVGACFNQTDKVLSLTCPQGHMVRVFKVIQGHSEDGECVYKADDCVHEIKDLMFPCVGRQFCDINLPSGEMGVFLHACKGHANYMQITYNCVQETEVVDICTTLFLSTQSGYIASPRYPNNYPSNLNCSTRIQTPFAGQKIRLTAIDQTLEGSTDGCGDSLYIYDNHRGYTTCSTVARRQLMLTMENYLELTFVSNSHGRQKGFWLYYEAEPHMTTTEAPPTPRQPNNNIVVTTPSLGNVSLPIVEAVTEPQDVSTKGPGNALKVPTLGFSIGLLVGVILGALLCALIIVLVIIILRKRRFKMSQSASCSSNVAIMASQISKPIPPQTIKNTLQLDADKTDNRCYKSSRLKGNADDVEIDMNFEKAGPQKGAFIDKNTETGEEQLYC